MSVAFVLRFFLLTQERHYAELGPLIFSEPSTPVWGRACFEKNLSTASSAYALLLHFGNWAFVKLASWHRQLYFCGLRAGSADNPDEARVDSVAFNVFAFTLWSMPCISGTSAVHFHPIRQVPQLWFILLLYFWFQGNFLDSFRCFNVFNYLKGFWKGEQVQTNPDCESSGAKAKTLMVRLARETCKDLKDDERPWQFGRFSQVRFLLVTLCLAQTDPGIFTWLYVRPGTLDLSESEAGRLDIFFYIFLLLFPLSTMTPDLKICAPIAGTVWNCCVLSWPWSHSVRCSKSGPCLLYAWTSGRPRKMGEFCASWNFEAKASTLHANKIK